MYVYVRNKHIIFKSKTLKQTLWFLHDCNVFIVDFEPTDRIIYEDNQVILYENSKQYIEDSNRYQLNKENQFLKKENKELKQIVDSGILKDKGNIQWWEKLQRKLYLLKSFRNAKKSTTWQKNGVDRLKAGMA